MQYNEFVHEAKATLHVTSEGEVLNVARAFLHTLTQHMAGNAADNLAAQLPTPLADIIHELSPEKRNQGQRFKLTEFYERVASSAGVDAETGKRYTHAFMCVFGRMVTKGEFEKIEKTLSHDYAPLFANIETALNAPRP